jgi:hypothetical protein
VYLVSMLTACAAALVVAVVRLVESDRTKGPMAIFLAYIALMAAGNAIDGRGAVKERARTGAADRLRLAPSLVVLIAATGMLAWSVSSQAWLFALFAMSGGYNAWASFRCFSEPPANENAWLRHHLAQLGAACIATVTAFVVVNASQVMPEGLVWIAWIMPGVIGGVMLASASRRFMPKA